MSNYPTSVDDQSSLYNPADSFSTKPLLTTLGAACLSTDVTIQLAVSVGTIGAPSAYGVLSIDDEEIIYTGSSGVTVTGCIRGAFGTTAVGHLSGVAVRWRYVAGFDKALQAAVEAIQTALGITGAFNFLLDPGGNGYVKRTAQGVTTSDAAVVDGPASAINLHVPQFDGTTGKLLKDGLGVVTTVGSPGSDSNLATEKAVRTAIGGAAATGVKRVLSAIVPLVTASPSGETTVLTAILPANSLNTDGDTVTIQSLYLWTAVGAAENWVRSVIRLTRVSSSSVIVTNHVIESDNNTISNDGIWVNLSLPDQATGTLGGALTITGLSFAGPLTFNITAQADTTSGVNSVFHVRFKIGSSPFMIRPDGDTILGSTNTTMTFHECEISYFTQ